MFLRAHTDSSDANRDFHPSWSEEKNQSVRTYNIGLCSKEHCSAAEIISNFFHSIDESCNIEQCARQTSLVDISHMFARHPTLSIAWRICDSCSGGGDSQWPLHHIKCLFIHSHSHTSIGNEVCLNRCRGSVVVSWETSVTESTSERTILD